MTTIQSICLYSERPLSWMNSSAVLEIGEFSSIRICSATEDIGYFQFVDESVLFGWFYFTLVTVFLAVGTDRSFLLVTTFDAASTFRLRWPFVELREGKLIWIAILDTMRNKLHVTNQTEWLLFREELRRQTLRQIKVYSHIRIRWKYLPLVCKIHSQYRAAGLARQGWNVNQRAWLQTRLNYVKQFGRTSVN